MGILFCASASAPRRGACAITVLNPDRIMERGMLAQGLMASTDVAPLDVAVLWARQTGLPIWELLQLLAIVAAYACFVVRTSDAKQLRPCLVVGFGGAIVGAV